MNSCGSAAAKQFTHSPAKFLQCLIRIDQDVGILNQRGRLLHSSCSKPPMFLNVISVKIIIFYLCDLACLYRQGLLASILSEQRRDVATSSDEGNV